MHQMIRLLTALWASFALHSALAAPLEAPRQVIEQRCVVCHACYDAPCQLKLEAHIGLERGANQTLVYDSTRLLAGDLTRLFDDAQGEAAWRKKDFYPVLDREQPERGLLYRMLALKQAHPLPARGPLPEGFDFSLHRDQQCVKPGGFDDFAEDYPQWGMPYGLPGLRPEEHRLMLDWLEAGAPAPPAPALPDALRGEVAAWERFLNQTEKRNQLMARYIYEHLFLATLYLEDAGQDSHWFRLVRSSSPPGEPVEVIATRRPYDDPGRERFWYRLQSMPIVAVAKSHLPYRFDGARRDWYRELFLAPDYRVDSLPGYDSDLSGNPFRSFADLPVHARYRFMLEEAEFTIMNFIKGPVCRGQIALNVIEDRFWVLFMDPEALDPELDGAFLEQESDNLRLPVPRTESVIDIASWLKYARAQARYEKAKAKHIETEMAEGRRRPELDLLWDGDGDNRNAGLTIFRHFDTASVVHGLVGETPKTAWVITYSLLERIHYLLVAGFDVYGSVAHQLESRLYMDFLRMEGEYNFLMFLPADQRKPLRDHWYRGAPDSAREPVFVRSEAMQLPTGVDYQSDDPKAEFLARARARVPGGAVPRFDYHRHTTPEIAQALDALVAHRGAHNRFLPEVSFVHVIGGEGEQAFTLLRDSGHSNIAQLFEEDERRLPEEDALTVVAGLIGAHPNQFFQVHARQMPLFAADIAALESAEDYATLLHRYGVRRNAPWFWDVSDRLQRLSVEQDGIAAGIFDLNRYHGYREE